MSIIDPGARSLSALACQSEVDPPGLCMTPRQVHELPAALTWHVPNDEQGPHDEVTYHSIPQGLWVVEL